MYKTHNHYSANISVTPSNVNTLFLDHCSYGLFFYMFLFFFFSSRRRHTRLQGDWSSDVCSSDLARAAHLGQATVVSWLSDTVRRGGCQPDFWLVSACFTIRNANIANTQPTEIWSVPRLRYDNLSLRQYNFGVGKGSRRERGVTGRGSAPVGAGVDRREGLLAQLFGVDLEAPHPFAQLPGARLVTDTLEVDADVEDRSPQAGVRQERRHPHIADGIEIPHVGHLGGHAHESGARVGDRQGRLDGEQGRTLESFGTGLFLGVRALRQAQGAHDLVVGLRIPVDQGEEILAQPFGPRADRAHGLVVRTVPLAAGREAAHHLDERRRHRPCLGRSAAAPRCRCRGGERLRELLDRHPGKHRRFSTRSARQPLDPFPQGATDCPHGNLRPCPRSVKVRISRKPCPQHLCRNVRATSPRPERLPRPPAGRS